MLVINNTSLDLIIIKDSTPTDIYDVIAVTPNSMKKIKLENLLKFLIDNMVSTSLDTIIIRY